MEKLTGKILKTIEFYENRVNIEKVGIEELENKIQFSKGRIDALRSVIEDLENDVEVAQNES